MTEPRYNGTTMKLTTPLLLTLPLLVTACGGEVAAPDAEEPAGATLPESYYAPDAPADAVDVTTLRSLESGAQVAVRGEVKDFVDGYAAFSLADHALTNCAEMGDDDHCATPWDFCCEDPAALKRGVASVEFRDGGQPVAGSVQGFHGVDHLTDVVVTGELQIDDAGNLLVIASALHVE